MATINQAQVATLVRSKWPSATASPPDVRRGSAPPQVLDLRLGLALGSGYA